MNALSILIPVALVLGLGGLIGFIWAVKTGQYEDMKGPPNRILFDKEEDEGKD